jgi:hypothetical protein
MAGERLMAVPVTEATRKTRKNPFRVRWEAKVYRADGTLKEERSGENSLVAGFAFVVWSLLVFRDSGYTEHDITNTLRSAYTMYPAYFPGYNGCMVGVHVGTLVSSNTCGIVVGTDNTAVTADDYALNTIVPDSGANSLVHMQCLCHDVVTDATTSTMAIDRVFLNHSGGTLTIKELGIYGKTNYYSWCLARDIIADPGVDVDDGEYIHVRYEISVTEA